MWIVESTENVSLTVAGNNFAYSKHRHTSAGASVEATRKKPALARVQKPTPTLFLRLVTLTFDLFAPK